MNQEDIFKKIGQILSELGDQYQYLAQHPLELNELELELFLANATFLADHVQIIKKISSKGIPKELPAHTEPVDEPRQQLEILPVAPQEEKIVKPAFDQDIFRIDEAPSSFEFILNDANASDKFEFEEKSIDEIFDRPLSEEEEQIIARKQKLREKEEQDLAATTEEDEIGPEPFLVAEVTTVAEEIEEPEQIVIPEPVTAPEPVVIKETKVEPVILPEPQIIAAPVQETVKQEELFRPAQQPVDETKPAGKPTLNDILAGNTNRTAAAQSGRMEITDLKQAISLNDKLRYIKDLFNGYNLAYAEAIDLLNKMPDFKSADTFLQHNYAVKNNWSAKQETADQFYALLNQRFPAK